MPHEPGHYDRDDDRYDARYARARGGFSFGSIITGVVVAFGAMLLLTALFAAVGALAGAEAAEDGIATTATQIGWAVGIALIIVQFLAYLWGGYTAGRMARGAGVLNGLLVPVFAIIIAVVIGALAALGAQAADGGVFAELGRFGIPFGVEQFEFGDEFYQVGLPVGILTLLAMFGGAILGGVLGVRWHDKLEAEPVMEPTEPRMA